MLKFGFRLCVCFYFDGLSICKRLEGFNNTAAMDGRLEKEHRDKPENDSCRQLASSFPSVASS
jgi:hypothetical protein